MKDLFMKTFTILYALLSAGMFSNIAMINAMDPANTPKKQIYTFTSAKEAISNKSLPSDTMLSFFLNGNNPPIMISGTIKNPVTLTKSKAIATIDNLAKNNPDIASRLKDPKEGAQFREDRITQVTSPQDMKTAIPVQYLNNQKPKSTICYSGLASADHEYGIKISEKEGTKTTRTFLFSPNLKDPSFIEEPRLVYVTTKEFAKQANEAVRKFEENLINEESFYGRRKTGDKYDMTSGWNGGEPVMKTEKRKASSKSK
jgi:hypothetical protein